MDDPPQPPVVVRDDQVVPERWDDLVRGVLDFRTLLGGHGPTGSLTAGVSEMGPGSWLGRHRHAAPELYRVLEGEGLVVVDGEEVPLRAGDTLLVPGDAEHGVRNTGPGTLRIFYVFAVSSFAEVEYRFTDDPRPVGG